MSQAKAALQLWEPAQSLILRAFMGEAPCKSANGAVPMPERWALCSRKDRRAALTDESPSVCVIWPGWGMCAMPRTNHG
ncbi:hypothetical protein CEXT_708241 [Caerostris extrusa]|uniref:Uncharacterized protein n=1 Tax=Caerostris extrusa TaxID=172846 RepID=A0AAV4Q7F3_CAEEX|nr:hypothetical protein CEXT_708241 [Caerostris extrusa]